MPMVRVSNGGTLSETTLWTNSATTSSFATQDVTLSDNITNYEYLKFEYNISTSDTTTCYIIVPVENLASATATDNSIATLSIFNSGAYRMRYLGYVSDTSINISMTYTIGIATADTYVIPTKIYGIK